MPDSPPQAEHASSAVRCYTGGNPATRAEMIRQEQQRCNKHQRDAYIHDHAYLAANGRDEAPCTAGCLVLRPSVRHGG